VCASGVPVEMARSDGILPFGFAIEYSLIPARQDVQDAFELGGGRLEVFCAPLLAWLLEGSPARALKIDPPFDGFYFIDMAEEKTSHLAGLCSDRKDVVIHTGDATEYLTKTLLPQFRYENYKRALCLLDPYGLHLDWEVIAQSGQSRSIDMFLNFPVMDMNRNAIWHHPENVPESGILRMNRFWGDDSWRGTSYSTSEQGVFWGDPEVVKRDNDAIVGAFCERLRNVAGFERVLTPLAMRNSANAVVYYLCFASQKPVAERIITSIFDRYRAKGLAAALTKAT